MLIRVEELCKVYDIGAVQVSALRGVTLSIAKGEMTAIMGPSGSGKSTLMNILGGLDQATSGYYALDGIDVSTLDDNELAQIRNSKIGFVFQNYSLLSRTTALDNVELPLIYSGARDRRTLAKKALERVGLGDRLQHRPNELSGGQQQRVAIARALVNDPAIILADEPTGNLDSKTGAEIVALFQELNEEHGITIVFVTHDPHIANHTRRIITLHDGQVESDTVVPEPQLARTGQDQDVAETEAP